MFSASELDLETAYTTGWQTYPVEYGGVWNETTTITDTNLVEVSVYTDMPQGGQEVTAKSPQGEPGDMRQALLAVLRKHELLDVFRRR